MNIVSAVTLPVGISSATKHTVLGQPIELTCRLRIVKLDGEDGFYLIRYGPEDQELTDTLHDCFSDAVAQAEFEYGIPPELWPAPPSLNVE
jgi:hypothetical protein